MATDMATRISRSATRPGPKAPGLVAAGLAAAVAIGLALPGALRDAPPMAATLAPAALLLCIGIVALAYTRPAIVCVAAFALSGIVRIEPAPTDLLLVTVAGVSLLSGRLSIRLPPSVAIALPFLLVIQVLSAVNATNTGRALSYVSVSIYLAITAVWLTGAFADRTTARLALKAYVIAATVAALASVLVLELHLPGYSTLVYGDSRAQGLFKDPNVFGPYLVPAAAIVLEEIGRPRLLGWGPRRLFLVLAILGAGVIFAYSRAGWLNFAIAAATVIVISSGRRGGLRAVTRTGVAVLGCTLIGFGLLAATGSLAFFSERSHVEAYDAGRFANQATGLAEASVHILGYGPGQAEETLAISTHSSYVRAAYEQGYLGLAALIALLAATLGVAIRSGLRDRDLHGLGSAAMLGALLGALANSAFVDTNHWRHLWLIFALIWAMAAIPARAAGLDDDESPT
jgi:hypothetical protein